MNKEPTERTPPYSEEVEAAVLGCALLDPEAAKVVSALDTDSFYDTRHREIHAALKKLNGESNLVSLHLALKASNRLAEAGGDVYIASLPDKTPSAANLPVHLEDLNNFAVRRAALRDAGEVERIAWDDSSPTDAVADASQKLLQSHARSSVTKDALSWRMAGQLVDQVFPNNDNILGDRLIAAGQSFVMVGQGGLGKSKIILQMLACIIAKRDFWGLETHFDRGSRWLVIQAENSNRRLDHDFDNLRSWLGDDWPIVRDNLAVHTLECENDFFLKLDDPRNERRLVELVLAVNPIGVVYDPLKDLGLGDLNTDTDMIASCQALARIARTKNTERVVGILHHSLTGKAAASRAVGYDRASFARNSKALHAWTRAQINVAPGAEDYSTLVISCGKCSNGREFPPFAVRRVNDSIFEPEPNFDLSAWQTEMASTGPAKAESLVSPSRVRELLSTPMTKAELAKVIRDDCGCLRANAYRYIRKAELARTIRFSKSSLLYSASFKSEP